VDVVLETAAVGEGRIDVETDAWGLGDLLVLLDHKYDAAHVAI